VNVTSTARHTYAHCEGWKDARLSAVKVHLLGQQLATKGFKRECHYMSKGCEGIRYVARRGSDYDHKQVSEVDFALAGGRGEGVLSISNRERSASPITYERHLMKSARAARAVMC